MQFFALVPIGHAYRECLVSIGLDDGDPFVSKIEYKGGHKKWRDVGRWVTDKEKRDLTRQAIKLG